MNEKRVLSDFKKPLFIPTQRVYNWHGCKSVLCCKGHNAFVMNVPYKIVPQRKNNKDPFHSPFQFLWMLCEPIQVQVSSKAWMTLSYAGGGVWEGRKPFSPLLPSQKECLLFGTSASESDEVVAAVSSGMLTWVSSPMSRGARLLLGNGRKVDVSEPGLLPRGPTGSREGCR